MAVMLAPGWFVCGGFYKIGEALVMPAVMAAVVLARRDKRAYGGLEASRRAAGTRQPEGMP
jgi:hypothetical protein